VRRARQAADGRPTRLTPLGTAVAVTATAALFVGAALVTGFLAPSSPSPDAPPATVTVVASHRAASVTFDKTGGWLADDQDGTVRHFDPATGATIGRPVQIGGRPISVVAGFGRIWVADTANSEVFRINPVTSKLVGAPEPVAQGPVSLAAGDGGVWVASLLSGTVSMLDPRTGALVASSALPDGAVRIMVGPDGVWVSGQTDSLTRVDPRPAGVSLRWRSVRVGQGPIGVTAGDGSVWVANVQSGSVSRVDPSAVRVTTTYNLNGAGAVSSDPEMLAVWQGKLWVAGGQQNAVVAIDPTTGNRIGSTVSTPGIVRQMVVDAGGTLWATTANPGSVVRFS
jgi:streptogramin lyase